MNIDFFDAPYSYLKTKGADCGQFQAGHNGPYFDTETSVRNTAHWLSLVSKLLTLYEDEELEGIAHSSIDYLVSKSSRPMRATFYCRSNPEKDFCNGLMGQAWAIEGLIAGHECVGREDALAIAKEVFYLHPFLEDFGIWRRVNVDGSYHTVDPTFNHQLWFAATATLLKEKIPTDRALRFLDLVSSKLMLYSNGIIYHASPVNGRMILGKDSLKGAFKNIYSAVRRTQMKKSLYSKSVGYHSFNLYAFAILYEAFPKHVFWDSGLFGRMIEVTKSNQFLVDLDESKYGWPYNPPGIELAYVGETFGLSKEYIQTWIEHQYDRTFNVNTNEWLTNNAPDQATSAARIYEACRLKGSYLRG